jgi:hypothetical protein
MDYCPVCGSAMKCTCQGKGVPGYFQEPRDCCVPGYETGELVNGLCEHCYRAANER